MKWCCAVDTQVSDIRDSQMHMKHPPPQTTNTFSTCENTGSLLSYYTMFKFFLSKGTQYKIIHIKYVQNLARSNPNYCSDVLEKAT